MNVETKVELAARGRQRVLDFCEENGVEPPRLLEVENLRNEGSSCGLYTPWDRTVQVCVRHCAAPGISGRQWSWPGYVIDRTPFGVYAHELGHYFDHLSGQRLSLQTSGMGALTGYGPNQSERFAEFFRLYVTNPDLLAKCAPEPFRILADSFDPVEDRRWDEVLADAPPRTVLAARRRVGPT